MIIRVIVILFGLLLVYVGSFSLIKLLKPTCLVNNDGTIRSYDITYFPLRWCCARIGRKLPRDGCYLLDGHMTGSGRIFLKNLDGSGLMGIYGEQDFPVLRQLSAGATVRVDFGYRVITDENFSDDLYLYFSEIQLP